MRNANWIRWALAGLLVSIGWAPAFGAGEAFTVKLEVAEASSAVPAWESVCIDTSTGLVSSDAECTSEGLKNVDNLKAALPGLSGTSVATILARVPQVGLVDKVLLRWTGDETSVVAQSYRVVGKNGNRTFQPCTALSATDRTVSFNPTTLYCTTTTSGTGSRGVHNGGLVVLEATTGGTTSYYAVAIPDVAMIAGSDFGVTLTLVDRWSDDHVEGEAREGFRVHGGVSAYYSLSRLKNQYVSWVANVSYLDMDDSIDFEVGLGTGLLFTPSAARRSGNGFGFVIGVGYNFMLDDSDDRWYTMVGLGFNMSAAN